MKALIALMFPLVAIQARAEMKTPGTVLATSCAKNVQAAKKVEVCYASVVGRSTSYFLIGTDIWSFNNKTSLEHVGTVVDDQIQNRLTTDIRQAQIKYLTGDAVEITSRGVTVRASDFEQINHTMSVD